MSNEYMYNRIVAAFREIAAPLMASLEVRIEQDFLAHLNAYDADHHFSTFRQ